MNGIRKIMSLMNFKDSYSLSTRNQSFLNEFNWLAGKISLPSNALFIGFAYAGKDYRAFFNEAVQAFAQAHISLTDLDPANAPTLISNAEMIVICGGDYNSFKTQMDAIRAGGYDPYAGIKARIDNAIPVVSWNQGAGVLSPYIFVPPAQPTATGINASPIQIVCNYTNNQQNKDSIKTFLLNNTGITEVICQVNTVGGAGTAVRLEDNGSGILSSGTDPYPTIVHYKIVGGNLVEY